MPAGNWKELVSAAERGDLDLMRYHLRLGVDPNYQHPEFLPTPLIEAARYNQPEAVRLLLEFGADPEIKAKLGVETAQSVARLLRHRAVLKVLEAG
ncbi:MAG: ankyrin repeat domain-containing protein [Bacteroidetes bacterium]|nr:MAG: ankyrin repeat domain-containing protein [Bacteroidota bacterium]